MSEEKTVHVLALFTAAPGKEAELEQALRALIEPTRREAGCIRYDLARQIDGPGEFAFIEEWATVASLDAHGRTEHLQEVRAKTPALVGAPPRVVRYQLLD